MIHVLTANPALDVTYYLDHFIAGEANRVTEVRVLPGGKGINVSRVLAQVYGSGSVAHGFVGGAAGEQLRTLLRELAPAVDHAFTDIPALTRTTVAVVDDRGATVFNEGGPQVDDENWRRLTAALLADLDPGDVLTCSGSLPPGSRPQQLATIIEQATEMGVRTIVDTSGPALRAAAKAGAWLLKPNHHELAELTGNDNWHDGVAQLIGDGARAIALSRGEDGIELFVATDKREIGWHFSARPPKVVQGNPTGAGDATVAAFTQALSELGTSSRAEDLAAVLRSATREAVAISGAAVLAPGAGEVDVPAYREMRELTCVIENDI